MIIEFSVENYRSLKERVTLSLEAEGSKSKADNVFEAAVRRRDEIGTVRLLKSAVLYGANASGKSNLIRAMGALQWWVTHSMELKVGSAIPCYEPFKLDKNSKTAPIEFELVFLFKNIKHRYRCTFSHDQVIEESLYYFPKGRPAKLFERLPIQAGTNYTTVTLGDTLEDKDISKRVFAHQLYLSQFGVTIPHDYLVGIYQYISGIEVWNTLDRNDVSILSRNIAENILDRGDESLRQQLGRLMKVADTGIHDVRIERTEEQNFEFSDTIPSFIRDYISDRERTKTLTAHHIYENGTAVGLEYFDLSQEESAGTQVLFALGGIILETLASGGVLFFDELDNSLHHDLCQFIVRLFRETATNPHNAQLIFTAHDVTLLDNTLIRKDQVWFTTKNKNGVTNLYPLSSIEQVREDTNFEAWYRSGKFRAKPKIKQLQFMRDQLKLTQHR